MAGIPTALVILICAHMCRNVGTVAPEARIIGGEVATPNEFPHQVYVIEEINAGGFKFCGGSILTAEYILTAAHCVKNVTISNIKIQAGKHNVDKSEPLSQEVGAASVFVHACFQRTGVPDRGRNDIALIKLDKILNYTKTVMPIQVDDSDRAIPHAGVTVIGWGRTDANDPSRVSAVLKKANLNISGERECETAYPFLHKESQLCAFSPVASSCQGDSGGSLICQEGVTRYVCGIVSFSGDNSCVNSTNVYTRVSYFNQWIVDIVKNGRQPSLDCDNLNPSTTPRSTEESTKMRSTDNVGNYQRPSYKLYYVVMLILFK